MIDPDDIEPSLLRAFVTVVETGSFTRTAERLHLSQSTVSGQVRRLEERLGRLLFQREGAAARLTNDGKVMLVHARAILEEIDQVRRRFSQPPLEGSVRFGMVEDFSATVLPNMLGRLRREHTHFELMIETGLSEYLLSRFDAGHLDLVLAKKGPGRHPGERLCSQKLVWVGQPGTLPSDASQPVPLVIYPDPSVTRNFLLEALQAAGRGWSIRFESTSLYNLRAAVLAGLGMSAFGVGLLPHGLDPLPSSAGLPALGHLDFYLAKKPDNRDQVVNAFGDILRTVTPLIVRHLEETGQGIATD